MGIGNGERLEVEIFCCFYGMGRICQQWRNNDRC
jgi:hypothetical protein